MPSFSDATMSRRRKPDSFVLVYGGSHGGWCWKYVAPLLRATEHEVYTPTLTGVRERAHLVRPGIGRGTHIQDIIGVLTYEDLQDVILVTHSLAGPVIEGVADRIPIPEQHNITIPLLASKRQQSA